MFRLLDPAGTPRLPARRRFAGTVAALGFLALLAGAALLDENRSRLLRMTPEARHELHESLRRFDDRLRPEQKRDARAIDDRLAAMPSEEREAYLIVLRRHHNWLASLPEPVRDEILSLPTHERLDRIRPLFAKYPPPDPEVRSPLEFIQIGGTGVFELASFCKTWIEIEPQDRKRLNELPDGERRAELLRLGRQRDIPRELVPDDFSMETWTQRAETRVKELREGPTNPNDWIGKLETRINTAAERLAEGKQRVPPFLHRLAVNLYLQEHKPAHPVDPFRLARFLDATPSWIQSAFYPFPSDEAKRRLTLVYRLIFPHPQEFGALRTEGSSLSPSPTAEPPKPAPPSTAPPRPVGEPTPF